MRCKSIDNEKKKAMKKKTYLFNSMLAAVLFAAGLTMGACADSDLDNSNSNNEGDKGAVVSFDIKDVQEAVLADQIPNTPSSRAGATTTFNYQLTELGLTQADLKPQVLEAQTPAGMEACLVETTIPGINPMQHDLQTRATVTKTLTADFSTLGCRGTSATNISSTPDWFYNARTKSNGELYEKLFWAWSKRFGRFYAVFPEVKDTYRRIKLSPATHVGNPYVDFEVDPNVANQKDLMTACSGVVEYQTQGVAPNTSLAFRHALTAVHFTVGQNLWAGQIDKIEISGAINKGTYTLSSDPNQPGTWVLGTTTNTCTLSRININTAASPGSVITDDNGNYTFFMIPQQVTGKNIYVNIHFQDGKTIHVLLKGKWLPGTTKTYTLSNLNSNWQYQLEVLGQNNTAAYDATDAGTYTVRSYRQAGGVQLPVAWKIVSYQESTDGGVNFGPEKQTKPTWLTNLSIKSGDGGTAAESGSATLTTDIIDKLAARNNALKSATALGSADSPYDLSTKGGSAQRNTANSYVISAPGYYKIPLVYGNAIKDGTTNSHAYTYNVILSFRDHAGKNITRPWITQSNGGANAPGGAKIVWADESGLVTNLAVTGSGTNAFLTFEVPANKIKNGNAVIAVKNNASGTVMWSWHLWFAPQDVLGTVACTNFQNKVYKFTNEPLGFKYTAWSGTTYSAPRKVKVKVRQMAKNGTNYEEGVITITQNNGNVRQGYNTLYQFGRKDAFPGTDAIAQGSYSFDNTSGGRSLGHAIQHPENMFRYTEISGYYWDWCNATYYNLWSADNIEEIEESFNDNAVVKTVYDPCPAGFHMPASNAFTGFTTTGQDADTQSQFNVSGDWDMGWNFKAGGSSTATVYFPASGYRGCDDGSLYYMGSKGCYWSAVPDLTSSGCSLDFEQGGVTPQNDGTRSYGCSVRPVRD